MRPDSSIYADPREPRRLWRLTGVSELAPDEMLIAAG